MKFEQEDIKASPDFKFLKNASPTKIAAEHPKSSQSVSDVSKLFIKAALEYKNAIFFLSKNQPNALYLLNIDRVNSFHQYTLIVNMSY